MELDPERTYGEAGEAERRGDLGKAEQLYRQFAAMRPEDPRGPNKLGVVCALHHDFDGAERYFRQALVLDSRHVPALTNMGNVLLERGQPEEALGYYEEALRWDPDYVPAHTNMAAALKKLHRISEMVSHLKHAQRRTREAERHRIQKDVGRGCMGRGRGPTVALLAIGLLPLGVFWR